jgi:transposase-like protein
VALIWITPRCIAGCNATLLKSRNACAGLGAAQQVAGMSTRPISKCVVDWVYLYRAVDEQGQTIDFYHSQTRNTKAASRFLSKALKGFPAWERSSVIHTDRAPTYGKAIASLKREGKLPGETEHRQIKYHNNVIEADHGKTKTPDQTHAWI